MFFQSKEITVKVKKAVKDIPLMFYQENQLRKSDGRNRIKEQTFKF